jgi:catechol 2,3-dioxygenase
MMKWSQIMATSAVQAKPAAYVAPAGTVLGHVHLQVTDAGRSHAFFTDALGFDTIAFYGSAAFVSAGGYHHHFGLNHWYSKDGDRPAPGSGGLDRAGIFYATQEELSQAVRRLQDRGVTVREAVDHGAMVTVLIEDPDGSGLELYWDRPGGAHIAPKPLDLDALIALTADQPLTDGPIPATSHTGYIDLAVIDLPGQVAFYRDVLGFTVLHQDDRQAYLSADGQHHLIGLRSVGNPGASKIKPTEPGLYHLALLYPTREDLGAVVRQLIDADAGFRMAEDHGVSNAVYFLDPENNGIEVYWDRPRDEWPRDENGDVNMSGGLLDLTELVKP